MGFRHVFSASALAVVVAAGPGLAVAAEGNPIFGAAKHEPLAKADLKKVTGKGATADYYGYYGYLYAAYAWQYGTYGYNYNDYSSEAYYYGAARDYAYYAYQYFYYAAYYAGT